VNTQNKAREAIGSFMQMSRRELRSAMEEKNEDKTAVVGMFHCFAMLAEIGVKRSYYEQTPASEQAQRAAEVLRVSLQATDLEIDRAFVKQTRRAMKANPVDPARLIELSEARRVLMEESERAYEAVGPAVPVGQ